MSSSSDDPWENDPLRQRVRKIKPQLSEGELVRVIGACNQAEAEMIQGMLLEEGVPSLLRRALGSDVPDFLAAGRRDVLVPADCSQPSSSSASSSGSAPSCSASN